MRRRWPSVASTRYSWPIYSSHGLTEELADPELDSVAVPLRFCRCSHHEVIATLTLTADNPTCTKPVGSGIKLESAIAP